MKGPTKAVIAAAGLGTRFLPWTKAMPKEMLPLGKEPIIQHIVDGLVSAGVEKIAIVGGPQKRAIENHFDPSVELEQALEKKNKTAEADNIRRISDMAHFVYIGQKGEPSGNARPLLNAVESGFIDEDESAPFFFMYADDFFSAEVPHAQQLRAVYEVTKKSVISLISVEPQAAERYGMAQIGRKIDERTYEISGLVEKPGIDDRPSDFAAVSGYLLLPEIIAFVRALQPSHRGEIELPEAIGKMAQSGGVVGTLINGDYHDAGDPTNYAIAVINYALKDEESKDAVRAYLDKRL